MIVKQTSDEQSYHTNDFIRGFSDQHIQAWDIQTCLSNSDGEGLRGFPYEATSKLCITWQNRKESRWCARIPQYYWAHEQTEESTPWIGEKSSSIRSQGLLLNNFLPIDFTSCYIFIWNPKNMDFNNSEIWLTLDAMWGQCRLLIG